jgi:VWFA-related protein
MRVRICFSVVMLLAVSSIAAFVVSAQTPTPTPSFVETDDVIRVDSRLIVVPVSVIDPNGNPVQGLSARDFFISEENRRQDIDNVLTAENVPLEIALLFDVSASTDKMFRFQQETAAKFLREVMRSGDKATIFAIGQKPQLLQARSDAEASVVSIFGITTNKEATAFYDTVRYAADYLRSNSPEGRRKVIIVISDGEDNFSEAVTRSRFLAERRVTANQPDPEYRRLAGMIQRAQQETKVAERRRVLRSLQDADAVLYAINPGGSSFHLNQISQFGQENMQIFADETGGTAFLPKFSPIDTRDSAHNKVNERRNTDMLERIFRQLASELRAQYLIQYYSETEFPEGRFVNVNVGLNGRSDLRVRARQGYYARN